MAQSDLDPMALLGALEIQTSNDLTHGKTSQKQYRNLLKYLNVTSFSQLEHFHRCPRKFQMAKERAAFQLGVSTELKNVDFAFGHAVGSGIQNYLITGNVETALLNCILAWNIDFEASIPKKRKNLHSAMIAVEMFAASVRDDMLGDWELLILPSGQPAIEVSFSLHCGNGFKHYMHMDIGLRDKRTRRIAVVDCKTSGFDDAEESLYGNSSQALSYGITLDACLPEELMDYTVFYLVFSSTSREWTLLPFDKSKMDQAEFIKDLLLTQDLIETYDEINFFPKRGNSCFEYFRRCEFYGECNLTADQKLPRLPLEEEAEKTDYVVDLTEVIESLKEKRK